MKHVIHTIALCLIVQPVFHLAAMAEPGDPQPNPQELSAGLEKCWNWFESLSDFQPYLPANMPPPKQWVQLGRLTARKCKLRGERDVGEWRVLEAQARVGDTDGLLASFREFAIEPIHQGRHLAKLVFVTKTEPGWVNELKGNPDFYRSYCLWLAGEYEDAGQFDKSIEVLGRLHGDQDEVLLIIPLAKAGQLEKAKKILASVCKRGNPYEFERRLALHLAAAGNKDEARKLVAPYLADWKKLASPYSRLQEARRGATLVKQLGDEKERKSFVAECEQVAAEVRTLDPQSNSYGSFSMAEIAVSLDDRELAKKSIRRAITMLKESGKNNPITLAVNASFQASLGLVEESKETAKDALAAARRSSDMDERERSLSMVARQFAIYRNDALNDETDATIREIRDVDMRGLAVEDVLELEITNGQWDKARLHLVEGRAFLRRQEVSPVQAFVHQFLLDLLEAQLLAKQEDADASRKLLKELLRRGYSPLAGDFTSRVFSVQLDLGFLEDAWWTATWIPELDERYSALGAVMEAAMEAKRAKER